MNPNEVQPSVRIVNYFTVIPGSVWGPRTIPDYELILALEGEYEFTSELEVDAIRIHPGQVLCIMPEERHIHRHCIELGERGVMSCIHLELLPDACRSRGDYQLQLEPKRLADISRDTEIPYLFYKCDKIYNGNHPLRNDLLRLNAAEIWLRLSDLWAHGPEGAVSTRTQAMRKFLEDNWNSPIGRNELAERFKLTPEHVNAIFHRETGITPGQYLTRLRVQRACQMLAEQGLTIKETAAACGFDDEFYFSRVFKKYTGRSPGQIKSSRRA